MQLASSLKIASWFVGGALLGLIEIITLPSDPNISTLLQLLPLLFLIGGIETVLSTFQQISGSGGTPGRLRKVMIAGWAALFGVDAGVASINNMLTQIFHTPIPYYFQGVSLAQKLTALTGIFVLGAASIQVSRKSDDTDKSDRNGGLPLSIWNKPVTNIGFITLLLGVVLGLAQYWSAVVFAGFILMLAGAMLYPMGRLIEKDAESAD